MAKKANKQPVRVQPPVSGKTPAPAPAKTINKKVEQKKKGLSSNLILALILAAVSFVVYANTLKNGYVLDDSSAIAENTIVQKGISAIPEIMTTPYRRGFYITQNDLYRPLSLAMLAVEYSMFGLNPAPNHFVNILVFAACVIALFFFLDRFFERKKTAVAFIAALLYALHPIHTEVVANVKSRDELLCFFFAFLSLIVFLKYMQTGKMLQLLLGSLCYFISYLSKETVVTFLAVFPLIFFFYSNGNKKRAILISVMSVVVTCLFLAIRFSVLRAYDADHMASIGIVDNALASGALTIESRMATAILILGMYLKLLVVPYPLVCDYAYNSIPFVHFSNVWVLLTFAIYAFLGVFGLVRLFKNRKDPYAFCILFYLITMALFSNIPFLIGATMGERFLFFGSVGFCLAVALLIDKFLLGEKAEPVFAALKNSKVLAIIIPISLIYAVLTINRNSEWLNNFTLYKSDIAKNPNSGKLNFFMGLELEKTVAPAEKDPAKQRAIRLEGLRYLKRTVEIDPDFAEGISNVGNAYSYLGMPDSAEHYEEIALKMFPMHIMTINNLADIYYSRQKYRQAISLSLRSIAINPNNASPYTNLGRSYLSLGKVDSTLYYVYKAIAINPDNGFSYVILAHTYKAMGKLDSMEKYIAIAKKYNPNFKMQ